MESNLIYEKLIEITLEKSVNYLSKMFKKKPHEIESGLNQGLTSHINKAIIFSDTLSVFKLPNTKKLFSNTIQLEISKQNRLFKSENNTKNIDELSLLNSNGHVIILGDVGAGKTTTLKRLVKNTFNLLFSENSASFLFSFPIVVKLGEIETYETLSTYLCKQLGIAYETIEKKEKILVNTYMEVMVFDEITQSNKKVKKEVEEERIRIIYEYKIGDYAIELGLSKYLDDICAIIFFDGLDEIHFSIKEKIFDDLKKLSQLLINSKIILSSRYIQELGTFKDFINYHICPLTQEQKLEITRIWLSDYEEFLDKLRSLPYYDLSDRPLFLTFLILLYINNNDELPIQSIDVYRQIVLLVIREWDSDKDVNIKRFSKYKSFDTYKKEDFLSEIAFELTYSQNVKKVFSERQLEKAYLEVYSRYPNLTIYDQIDIIKDIESHNGLIIETSNKQFEFSHLSLQEYLCAKYILSIPFSRKNYEYLNTYAAPFAIANVLSPKPDEWFAMLFLYNIDEIRINYQLKSENVYEFIDRLIIEKITFPYPSESLGLSVIYLKTKFLDRKLQDKINQFGKIKYVKESLIKAEKYYVIKKIDSRIHLKSKGKKSELPINLLQEGYININDYWNSKIN